MNEPPAFVQRDFVCQAVLWRVAKFPDWVTKHGDKLTPRAFRRQGPRGELPAERGLSVFPEGTCTPEDAVKRANGGVAIGIILAGHVYDAGLQIERDATDHATILGMPLKGDPGDEDDIEGMRTRAELARRSRILDWSR